MTRFAWIAVTWALVPVPALCDDLACADFVQAAPAHPGSTDMVALRAQPAVPADGAVLARAAVSSTAVDLEIVVTDAPQALYGYRRVGDPRLDAVALVGPLAAGAYAVTTRTRLIAGGVETACEPRRSELVVAATAAPVVLVDVVEYYDAVHDRHFMTAGAREIADLDAEPGRWARTGRSFKAYALYGSDNRAEPVCRYERSGAEARDGYVVSASYRECAALAGSDAWRYDLRAFDIVLPDTLTGECPPDTRPVYRVWNARSGDHRWTTDAVLRASLVARGWVPEGYDHLGTSMCTPGS
jgi:hypothetical protein